MVKAEKDILAKECQMRQQTNNKDDSGKRETARYLSHCDEKKKSENKFRQN